MCFGARTIPAAPCRAKTPILRPHGKKSRGMVHSPAISCGSGSPYFFAAASISCFDFEPIFGGGRSAPTCN